MRPLFLINRRSGKRRAGPAVERLIETTCEYAGIEYAIRFTESREELDGIIGGAERESYDTIVAVGGDGTVNEIGRRLIGRRLALGIIPTGSGNGFARHLRIPLAVADAVSALVSGETTRVDTAVVNGVPFLMICGVGFDALVAHRFAESKVRGLQTYVREATILFSTYRPEHYTISIDGKVFEDDAFLVAIANSSQYGNEAKIAPLASLQDGLLDVCLLQDVRLVEAPLLLQKLFLGQIHETEHFSVRRGATVTIERDHEGAAHVDGEPLVLPKRIECSILPHSLRVVVPHATDL